MWKPFTKVLSWDTSEMRAKIPVLFLYSARCSISEWNISTTVTDDIQTPTPIPMDIALIVVAAIVSLGLTSLAVVMVLHMRSKLFETIRLSVYDDEKTKGQERESVNSARMSAVMNTALPREYRELYVYTWQQHSLLDRQWNPCVLDPDEVWPRNHVLRIVLTVIASEKAISPIVRCQALRAITLNQFLCNQHLCIIFADTVMISALPICANPVFAINTEPETILTVDGIESLNTYANGAATIGLRISGNFRGKFALNLPHIRVTRIVIIIKKISLQVNLKKSLQITASDSKDNLYNANRFFCNFIPKDYEIVTLNKPHTLVLPILFLRFSTDSFITNRRSVTRQPLRPTISNSDTSAYQLGP